MPDLQFAILKEDIVEVCFWVLSKFPEASDRYMFAYSQDWREEIETLTQIIKAIITWI